MIGLCSKGMTRLPYLAALLGDTVVAAGSDVEVDAFAGWGAKPSARRAEQLAQTQGLQAIRLEDGFLRSFGTGDRYPPLSIAIDRTGIYYDATRPSDLEQLLNSDRDLLEGISTQVDDSMRQLIDHRLSKYNHAPDLDETLLVDEVGPRVLVVDQTHGDMSVVLSGAGEGVFADMLAAARQENPEATLYIKTHPETASGRKGGYFTDAPEDGRTRLLRESVNPIDLLAKMDRVYVVSSQLGFEALLMGKEVTCFGLPFYAGWGVTDDRLAAPRRQRQRSVHEIFAAAYHHYCRYLDPYTGERGSIFDVIRFLVAQKAADRRLDGRAICLGIPLWKRDWITPFVSMHPGRVHYVHDSDEAGALHPGPGDRLIHWGSGAPPGLETLAASSGARMARIEDGFIRSVGLGGAGLTPPSSLVLDHAGIYFDPTRPSELEGRLNAGGFSADELRRAASLRERIVREGITKYNIQPITPLQVSTGKRPVIFVPGQVEDDASIQLGCEDVRSNKALLEAVREANPDAHILFKPHPDVQSGNRNGRGLLEAWAALADQVEVEASVVSCISVADQVHTMTSLSGFDALLRDKAVTTYGRPFYAGWGLTRDHLENPRRQRRLSLDELVAGTLLHYPLYRDWVLNGFTECETVVESLYAARASLEHQGTLGLTQFNPVSRRWRKSPLPTLLRRLAGILPWRRGSGR